jgi:hypothetical protein
MRTPWPLFIGTLVGTLIGPGLIMNCFDGEPNAERLAWIFAPVLIGFLLGFWIDVELDKPPERRLFRFKLRTLFVAVTVFAVWLGLELKFVRERQAWIRENAALVRPIEPLPDGQVSETIPYVIGQTKYFPFWRRWLGDAPVPSIILPTVETDHDSVQRLFPEANISKVWSVPP